MIILGFDPGTARLGYGVIEKDRGTRLVSYGTIEPSSRENRLLELSREIERVLDAHRPVLIGIERLYFSKNKKTAISVAEARGVILVAAQARSIPVREFTPTDVKSTVTGWGKSDKETVRKCVSLTLKNVEICGHDDAADALAIALRASFDVRN